MPSNTSSESAPDISEHPAKRPKLNLEGNAIRADGEEPDDAPAPENGTERTRKRRGIPRCGACATCQNPRWKKACLVGAGTSSTTATTPSSRSQPVRKRESTNTEAVQESSLTPPPKTSRKRQISEEGVEVGHVNDAADISVTAATSYFDQVEHMRSTLITQRSRLDCKTVDSLVRAGIFEREALSDAD